MALRPGWRSSQDRPLRIGLNVPNGGAITGFRPDDVVEVTCEVDGSGIHPVYIGEVPEGPYLLMRSIKHYERLAVQSILFLYLSLVVEALAVQPLVGSYALAEKLVGGYLDAHRSYIEDWN